MALLDVLNSYWLQKLVELRQSKKKGQMNRGTLGNSGNQYCTGNWVRLSQACSTGDVLEHAGIPPAFNSLLL